MLAEIERLKSLIEITPSNPYLGGSKCVNKDVYESAKLADEKLTAIKETDGRSHKKPVRSYKCNTCGKYHLTSIPKKWYKKSLGNYTTNQ